MACKRLGGAVVCVAWLAVLSCTAGWTSIPHDGDPGTIGDCLAKPDGTTVTLPAEQIMWRGKSGKSFAIREWFERLPNQPRLVVVSTQPLPVESYWTVDVTGTLGTFPEAKEAGTVTTQRVIMVSPENVVVYCSPNGRPAIFLPVKGYEDSWSSKV